MHSYIRESHNALISAMLNWYEKCLAIFISRTEAITCLLQIGSDMCMVMKKEKGNKGSIMIQLSIVAAAVGEKAYLMVKKSSL